MKNNILKYVIIFAIISVGGILLTQFIFLKNSFNLTEKQFQENTKIALKEVALQILDYNNKTYGHSAKLNNLDPVDKVTDNYYIVNVNDVIDGELLRFHLTEEFRRHALNVDFEFAVYDCHTERMVYGAYICAGNDSCDHVKNYNLPKTDKYTYYFGVHFPNRSPYFNSRLKGWYFFTFLLVVVFAFFGYTVYVIIKQRQLSEVQKNFINNLTHELKTPISSIALSVSVINNRSILDEPERLFRYAQIIQEQNNRMLNNVEKVLNLAAIEKNRIQLKPEEIDIKVFIEHVIGHFRLSNAGQNADVTCYFDRNFKILADHFHFNNLIINILENAVKYCDQVPEVKITGKLIGRKLQLSIIDNGIGIPREYHQKIFTKFFRIPTGNIHNVKGFGLGLDYVRKITDAHRWKIRVENNPSGGSIFILKIPIIES